MAAKVVDSVKHASDVDSRCAITDDASAGIAIQAVSSVAEQIVDSVNSASDMDSRCATTDDAGAGIAVQAVDLAEGQHVATAAGASGVLGNRGYVIFGMESGTFTRYY